MRGLVILVFSLSVAFASTDTAVRSRCLADTGDSFTAASTTAAKDVRGVWAPLNLQPTALLSSGAAFTAQRSSAFLPAPLRTLERSSWSEVGVSGDVVPQSCGLRCRSLGVRFLTLRLPLAATTMRDDASAGEAWTVSLWLQTLALDASLRGAGSADGKRVSAADGLTAAGMRTGNHAVVDALVIGVEDGVLSVGGVASEVLRSSTTVADGRWHHVVVTAAPAARGDSEQQQQQHVCENTRRLSLFVDGVLHMQHDESSLPGSPLPRYESVNLGSLNAIKRHSAALKFIDEVAIFDWALEPANVTSVFNALAAVFSMSSCSPSMPWLQPPLDDSDGEATASTQRETRVAVLILSDSRPHSASLRAAARSTWLQLAAGKPLSHVFCLSASFIDGSEETSRALYTEASLYRDLLFVNGSENYQQLTQKMLGCYGAVMAATEGASVRSSTGTPSPPDIAPFDYLIKTDHDVFLRVDTLYDELHANAAERADTQPTLFWQGFVYSSIPPMRDLSDKNADVSLDLMTFPSYTAGVAVVLSSDLLKQILRLRSPIMSLNEDQALGLWIAQRELEFSEAPVIPLHDWRFQQREICTLHQLAIHPTDRKTMRQLARNLADGIALCSYLDRPDTCLCCNSTMTRDSWFMCDPMRGAQLLDYESVEEATGIPWSEIRKLRTPTALLNAVANAFYDDSTPASCPWAPSAWHPVGLGWTQVSGDAVDISCRDRAASLPASAPCASGNLMCNDGGRSRSAVCGASLLLHPPRVGEKSCPPMVPPGVQLTSELILAAGDITRYGAFRDPDVHCKSAIWGSESSKMASIAGEPQAAFRWLLFSAVIDSSGACMLSGMDPVTRKSFITEDITASLPPSHIRPGKLDAQCIMIFDIVHSDGLVTVGRSPLARNTSTYLHYEVFPIDHVEAISEIYVTVLLPDDGASAPRTSIRVRDVQTAVFTTPSSRRHLSRREAYHRRIALSESVLRHDKRIEKAAENSMLSVRPRRLRGVLPQFRRGLAVLPPVLVHSLSWCSQQAYEHLREIAFVIAVGATTLFSCFAILFRDFFWKKPALKSS